MKFEEKQKNKGIDMCCPVLLLFHKFRLYLQHLSEQVACETSSIIEY